MIGAVVGPVGVLETILAASVVGLVMGVGWALATREWNAPFGFGPAMSLPIPPRLRLRGLGVHGNRFVAFEFVSLRQRTWIGKHVATTAGLEEPHNAHPNTAERNESAEHWL